MTDFEARKKADLEAYREALRAEAKLLRLMANTGTDNWPISEPVVVARVDSFMSYFERSYRDGYPARFPISEQTTNIRMSQVRSAISGDPYWWSEYFIKWKLRSLRNTCGHFDIQINDLPWWLRGLQPGSEQKSRFDLIFEWV